MNIVYVVESNIRNMDWAEVPGVGAPPDEILAPESTSSPEATCLVATSALHSMDHVGIDTCSAMSVSSEIGDFTFIDSSDAARNSISLRGVGGEQASVGGRGPLLISTKDSNGKNVFLVDPQGVYLQGSDTQFRLRILGQQRMKTFGFALVQNKYNDGEDHLVYQTKNVQYCKE